jgi:hypothetical protein
MLRDMMHLRILGQADEVTEIDGLEHWQNLLHVLLPEFRFGTSQTLILGVHVPSLLQDCVSLRDLHVSSPNESAFVFPVADRLERCPSLQTLILCDKNLADHHLFHV